VKKKVERCLRGRLKLDLDDRGRLVRACFTHKGKRVGPTLTLKPDFESGEYRRIGDSHMDSYGGGRASFYTAWCDGPASEGALPYDSWVGACLEQLRHIGVEISWHEAQRALKRGRWKTAARGFAEVQRHWRGYGGGWAFNADVIRKEGAIILRLLHAVAEARTDASRLSRVKRAMAACRKLDSQSARVALAHAEKLLKG
jgi:hypothetical protein